MNKTINESIEKIKKKTKEPKIDHEVNCSPHFKSVNKYRLTTITGSSKPIKCLICGNDEFYAWDKHVNTYAETINKMESIKTMYIKDTLYGDWKLGKLIRLLRCTHCSFEHNYGCYELINFDG